MKRSVTFLIAILAVVLAVPAFAGTNTSNVTVTATVAQVCGITNGAVAFGAYDPIVANNASPLNATGTLTVTCTKGATGVWVGLGVGSYAAFATAPSTRAMKEAASANYLSYELYKDAARTLVWGNATATAGSGTGQTVTFSAGAGLTNPASLTIYGQVPAAQNVATGSYSDTVVATVNF